MIIVTSLMYIALTWGSNLGPSAMGSGVEFVGCIVPVTIVGTDCG